jgi:hypothetical protein
MELKRQIHTPAALSQRKASCARSREGWIGPKAGMDVLESKKISCTYWGSNSGSSSK